MAMLDQTLRIECEYLDSGKVASEGQLLAGIKKFLAVVDHGVQITGKDPDAAACLGRHVVKQPDMLCTAVEYQFTGGLAQYKIFLQFIDFIWRDWFLLISHGFFPVVSS
jgi:hypothetical protein